MKPWSRLPFALAVFASALLILFLPPAPDSAARLLSSSLPPDSARQAAEDLRLSQVANGRAPAWGEATLGDAQPLNDLQGQTTAYLFALSSGPEPAGYIVIARLAGGEIGAAEYAVAGASPLDNGPERARLSASAGDAGLLSETPIYFGPLGIAYEITPLSPAERRFVDLRSGEIHSLSADRQADLERQRANLLAAPPRGASSPAQERSYQRIDGVPAYTQYDAPGCLSGCTPTSVAQVMGYWDRFSEFSNLIDGDNWQAAVDRIRALMGTWCSGGIGLTTVNPSTAVQYPHERGYGGFTADLNPDPNFSATHAEFDAGRPAVVSFYDWKGGHSVVGIGYSDNSLIVIDNSYPNAGQEINIDQGWYPYIGVMRFCPPGRGCNTPAPPKLVCPQTGGVLLYKNSSYDCNNEGEGAGYLLASSSGSYNVSSQLNDQASSLRVPDGWSAALYQDSGSGGGKYCVNAPGLVNFANLTFDNGAPVSGNVSSFRVFTNPDCDPPTPSGSNDNTPPYAYYTSPSGGSTVGRSATLAAYAADSQSAIAKVQFGALWSGTWHVVGEALGSETYQTVWDLCASNVPDGEIKLGLKVTDVAGNLYQIPSDQLPTITKSYNCTPSGSMWLWNVKYWNYKEPDDTPDKTAIVSGSLPYVFHHWGYDSPSSGINSDNWSARYTQTFYFPGGDYRFHCQHEDGCRIYVDGVNWIDAWWEGYGGHDLKRYLSPGNHEVRIDYMDVSGEARLEAWWQGPGFLPEDILPDNPAEYSHVWRAEYWVFPEFIDTTPQFTRMEDGEFISHDWGTGGPDPMLPSDGFRAKFTRQADFDCGEYRFDIYADDGVKFTIDDQLLLNEWRSQSVFFNFNQSMSRGTHNLRLDYYEDSGSAGVSLSWTKVSDCQVALTPQYVSQMYVKPDEYFAPTIRLQVDNGYLDPLRSDRLVLTGGADFGADGLYVRDMVNASQRYSFDGNSPDPFWLGTFGVAEGVYSSDWQMQLGSGAWVGPVNTLQIIVDGSAPLVNSLSPASGSVLTGGSTYLSVDASDSSSIEQVEFFAAYDDGSGWRWRRLGADIYGGDGWGTAWSICTVPPGTGAAVYAYAWDRAHNGQGVAAYSLTVNSDGKCSGWGGSLLAYLPMVVTSRNGPAENHTLTLSGMSDDGELGNMYCNDWATCRGAQSGNYLVTEYPGATVSADWNTNGFHIRRLFLFFDASSLPANAQITSARLTIYAGPYQAGDNRVAVVDGHTVPALVQSDFGNISYDNAVQFQPDPNTFSELSLPASWINPGGITNLAIIHALDLENNAPYTSNNLVFAMSEDPDHPPRLVIEYTTP